MELLDTVFIIAVIVFSVIIHEISHGAVALGLGDETAKNAGRLTLNPVSHIDPIGSCVGQRGVRVSTVMSELGGEKIDLIMWSEDAKKFIEDSLSPAQVQSVMLDEEKHQATITVSTEQQSLAIGRGGQNVRLAAKLTGWKLDIVGLPGEIVAEATAEGDVVIEKTTPEGIKVVSEGAEAPADTQ